MRTSLLLSLKTDVAHVERLLDMAARAPDDFAQELTDEAMCTFNALFDKAEPDQQYCTMVEAFMSIAHEKLLDKYSNLLVVEAQLTS